MKINNKIIPNKILLSQKKKWNQTLGSYSDIVKIIDMYNFTIQSELSSPIENILASALQNQAKQLLLETVPPFWNPSTKDWSELVWVKYLEELLSPIKS